MTYDIDWTIVVGDFQEKQNLIDMQVSKNKYLMERTLIQVSYVNINIWLWEN